MKIFALIMFSWMFLIPEVSTNNNTNENEFRELIEKLEFQYGEETLKLSFFSINELRPYTILQNESTVAKYTNKWLTPLEYLSSLDIEDRKALNSRILEYIEDFDKPQKEQIYSKIANYLYTYNVIEKLMIGSSDSYKIKIFQILRQLDVTNNAFDNIPTLGEFQIEDLKSNELNQAKVKAYNNIADLNEKSRLSYFSEFFKNISKV